MEEVQIYAFFTEITKRKLLTKALILCLPDFFFCLPFKIILTYNSFKNKQLKHCFDKITLVLFFLTQ